MGQGDALGGGESSCQPSEGGDPAREVAENVLQGVSEDVASTTGSGSRTDNTSGDPDLEVPANVPEDVPENVAESVPQDVAEAVAAALGRAPQGRYQVVVSHPGGAPRVIRNSPFLDDGTPMPTLYWLVCPTDRRAVSRLESAGGVKAAEAAVDAVELAAAHAAYASERDADIPIDQEGPRPSGGVGGTRRGVKCLHAHYAWYLAGGGDPVGAWVAARLSLQEENDDQNDARLGT